MMTERGARTIGPQSSHHPSDEAPGSRSRADRLGLLARADAALLERHVAQLGELPPHSLLRPPETGLVMVRARIGGSGNPFNLGEMTVTRCSVTLATGETGHAYVRGRSQDHARLAALVDALCQAPALAETVERAVFSPLARAEADRHAASRAETDATRVSFYTIERGDAP